MVVQQFSSACDVGILFPGNIARSRRWNASRVSNSVVSCNTSLRVHVVTRSRRIARSRRWNASRVSNPVKKSHPNNNCRYK